MRWRFTLEILAAAALLLLAAAGLAAAETWIEGCVLDAGAGVEAVEVRLEPRLDRYRQTRLLLEGKVAAEPAAHTRTDAEGCFRLQAPEPGLWKVVVEAEGHPRQEETVTSVLEDVELPAIELEEPVPVEIEVRDAEGRPLPALVALFPGARRGRRVAPTAGLEVHPGFAGDDGRVRLPRSRAGHWQVVALAEGLPLATASLEPASPPRLELRFPAGRPAALRVVDASRRPVAEALVFRALHDVLPIALTDEAGIAHLALATGAGPSVSVLAADGSFGHTRVELGAADDRMAELELRPPIRVSGTVVEVTSGDPIAGALVVAGLWGSTTLADTRGRWQLTLSAQPPIVLGAHAGGYASGHADLRSADGEGGSVTFELKPVASVSGTVTDAAGAPLFGVTVAVLRLPETTPEGLRPMPRHGSPSSRRGRFHYSGLEPGVSHALVFRKDGYVPERVVIEALPPFEERSGLEVVLRADPAGSGRPAAAEAPVIDRDRAPRRQAGCG